MKHDAILPRAAAAALLLALAPPTSGDPLAEARDCVIGPHEVVDVSSAVPGLLEEVAVERSDSVHAGQLLARLESRVERVALELAQAWAAIDSEVRIESTSGALHQRRHERMTKLYASKAVAFDDKDRTQTEVELAALRVRQAREKQWIRQLDAAKAQAALERRMVLSPIDGVVVERYRSAGEYVENQPILRVARLDPLQVETIVPMAGFGQVEPGMVAEVSIPGTPGDALRAVVRLVDRMGDAASNTFSVRLTLPNPDGRIAAGVRCSLRFRPGERAPIQAAADPAAPGTAAPGTAAPDPAAPGTAAPGTAAAGTAAPDPAAPGTAAAEALPTSPAAPAPLTVTPPRLVPEASRPAASNPANPQPVAPQPEISRPAARRPGTPQRAISRPATSGPEPARSPPTPAWVRVPGTGSPPASTVSAATVAATNPAGPPSASTARAATNSTAMAPARLAPAAAGREIPVLAGAPAASRPSPAQATPVALRRSPRDSAATGRQVTPTQPGRAAEAPQPTGIAQEARPGRTVQEARSAHSGQGMGPGETAQAARCTALGPLDDARAARDLVAAAGKHGVQATVYAETVSEPIGYIVVTPAQADLDAAKRLARDAAAAGVLDLQVLLQGAYANRVALGVYSRASTAGRRRDNVIALGVAAEVLERTRSREQWWVRLEAGDLAGRLPAALLDAAAVTRTACAPGAAPRVDLVAGPAW